MKKICAVILALLCMTATVCGCGDKNETSRSSNSSNASSAVSSQTDDQKSDNASVKVFGDLPKSESVLAGENDDMVYFSIPNIRSDNFGRGFSVSDSLDYAIIVSSAASSTSGAKIDDVFSTTYNEDYQSILGMFNKAKYDAYTPEITDRVTLTCGAEAVKFEGKQSGDDYGTPVEFYISGYGFVFNDVPMIVSYVVADETKVDDAKKAELQGYVDEMIHTVRTQP